MEPKLKAEELFNKYCYAIRTEETDNAYWTNIIYAKQCALIAVDEIIENNKSFLTTDNDLHKDDALDIDLKYWQEVKNEINKL